MNAGDLLLLFVRWAHGIAAISWVGGGIFYFLVLRPIFHQPENQSTGLQKSIGKEFGHLINSCMIILLLSGVIMTLERLTSPYTDTRYVVVLSIKISIAFAMFWIVRSIHRSRSRVSASSNLPLSNEHLAQRSGSHRVLSWTRKTTKIAMSVNVVLVLGILVFLLADLLAVIYEINIIEK
ncbi:hypothetical protein FIM02_01730 [SAR202 cluster bacterium AD-802-E10_MRT_200m]|nr:hypothetical protein [SAR202 cluster bacterium AD-802-E10_MRT_200m]